MVRTGVPIELVTTISKHSVKMLGSNTVRDEGFGDRVFIF